MRGPGRRTFAISAALIAAISNVAADQTSRAEATLPPVFIGVVQAVDPPGQAGSWALQIASRGGLVERHSHLTIRSDGTLTRITPGSSAASIHPDTLVSLNQRIRAIATTEWRVDSRLGICSDCPATLIVLSVRESSGRVSTYTAFWDATTKATIPEELRRIHDLTLTIQQH
jgi:hypothetical protein